MNTKIAVLLGAALAGLAAHQAQASVVISNLDPANTAFGGNAPEIGQAMLTGNRPISLTSVQFQQTGTSTASAESFAVYSRNADGTLGSQVFNGFTLTLDSATAVTTAAVTSAFTLQANTGYYFVLSSNTSSNVSWTYTSSTDYAFAFGASIPANDSSVYLVGGTLDYFSLAQGPQEFQVNGLAGAAVPEPSTWAVVGCALAVGAARRARRTRHAA